RATEANFDRVVTYTERMIEAGHREFAARLVRDALERTPEIANSYAFIRAQGGEIGAIIKGD
ncbi:ATP-binding protein, partial [Paraburkholderia sp. SIMBA_053]